MITIGTTAPIGSGGGAGSPNLQAVTAAGDTTTIGIVVLNGATHVVTLDPAGAVTVADGLGNKLTMTSTLLEFIQGAFSMNFSVNVLTGNQTSNWRDLSGTVAYLSDIPAAALVNAGTFTQAGFTGVLIQITHGLSYIPTYANVVGTDLANATILQGGYFISTDALHINVNLKVPVMIMSNISFLWTANS